VDKKTRIYVIFAVADKLAAPGLTWARVNVILGTYGLEPYSQSSPTTLAELVSSATDDVLVELADYLDIAVPVSYAPPAAIGGLASCCEAIHGHLAVVLRDGAHDDANQFAGRVF
jgi:hypothetical protein